MTEKPHDHEDIPEFLCRRCHPEIGAEHLMVDGILHKGGCACLHTRFNERPACDCGAIEDYF